MGQPQARVTDMHVCPMVTPVSPDSARWRSDSSAVRCYSSRRKLPAARITDMCVCVGPPDVIALGSLRC